MNNDLLIIGKGQVALRCIPVDLKVLWIFQNVFSMHLGGNYSWVSPAGSHVGYDLSIESFKKLRW